MSESPLLRAVLGGQFRPDRESAWLLEHVLPQELPVKVDDEPVRRAWSRLVDAQTRYLGLGVPVPTEFAGLSSRSTRC